jgi:hypothetical protein
LKKQFQRNKNVIHIADNSLIQQGYLLDEDGNILEQKYYLSLKDKKAVQNVTQYMGNFSYDNQEVCDFICGLYDAKFAGNIEHMYHCCLQNFYKPFLWGLNTDSDGATENKIYYIFDRHLRATDQKQVASLLLEQLNILSGVRDYVDISYEHGLFLRGLALGILKNIPVWRLYFFRQRGYS